MKKRETGPWGVQVENLNWKHLSKQEHFRELSLKKKVGRENLQGSLLSLSLLQTENSNSHL
jgi:hypothetical protein